MQNNSLIQILQNHKRDFGEVLPSSIQHGKHVIFDFSGTDRNLPDLTEQNIDTFNAYMQHQISQSGAVLGIVRYLENRVVYQNSPLFQEEGEARSMHLAIDLWAPPSTPITAPLHSTVHSFGINDHFLDYGGTVILQHELDGVIFYTLYGHLSHKSLTNKIPGQTIHKSEEFAWIGGMQENGHWSPHLHFEIIADMQGKLGDFPGVCKPSEKEYWSGLCLNPNLILKISQL